VKARAGSSVDRILERADGSLLEIIDHVLSKGVMVDGEVFIGVAGIDLIYLRLSAVLCAADKVLPGPPPPSRIERAARAPDAQRTSRARRARK
jgi:hypothetical protein